MRNLIEDPPDDPQERVLFFARRSVARGTGFAGLAVGTLVTGFAFSPVAAAHAGTLGTGLIAAVLAWKAYNAPGRPYKETEVWVMLEKQLGLPEYRAQQVIGEALRQCYWRFARYAGIATVGIWLLGVALRIAGFSSVVTI